MTTLASLISILVLYIILILVIPGREENSAVGHA